ncbi:TBC1 domain family member 2A isoform X1 [Fundulus heteroclitus]|uniref:TBC1 domain family member 2A isoform X1 n=2 Tax=Fundulus heteroclitus TaxID=8078 RepID=UPI00165AA134|nr:TBC1 domain family member 2A isoform X1 [Fundulus heteroclitus]XP_021168362.2 TBC1 domain family member 2A isoform X1 [Fundulus heteroclitus]
MDGSGAAGNPGAASCDSLPAPADQNPLHPDSQNQSPTGTAEPPKPGCSTEQHPDPLCSAQQELTEEPPSKPGTLCSVHKEPGGSTEGPTDQEAEEEPPPGTAEVLTAGAEDFKDLQDHQEPGELHQDLQNPASHQNPQTSPPSGNLPAGPEEIWTEGLDDLPPSSEDPPDPKQQLLNQQNQQNQQNLEQVPGPGERQDMQGPAPYLDQVPVDPQNHLPPPSLSVDVAPPLTIEAFCHQVAPRPPGSSSGEPKLCGYLQKQAGPLRAWKLRWFSYEEKKNQLFYYRTPQDVMPLGRVELSGATFTYPLKAESGTFHIKTPERTFILKAVSQELMLYWLQQLQVRRWHHQQNSTCSQQANNNNNMTDHFLPVLKSPVGLVGQEAAIAPTQRTPLASMSIKHPLIQIQNSVHSLRKRTSQDSSQTLFYSDVLPWIGSSEPTENSATTDSRERPAEAPPPPEPAGDPAAQARGAESGGSAAAADGRSRRTGGASTMPASRRDTSSSSERAARLQQEKQMLVEEVRAQKELVWILHKALEAAQLEKRTCAEFVAVADEQQRLELLRHRERQAADLRGRLEESRVEAESLRRSLADRDARLAEQQDDIRLLTEKNAAKQQVIIKLSDHMTSCLADPRQSDSPGSVQNPQNQQQLQQQIENLKDDMEAYKTQNKFLNSEIYQLTKLWRKSSEQERSLMVKCAYLEATNCQMESRYLGVLRKLQEAKSLAPEQQEAVQKMIEEALRGELKSIMKLSSDREYDEYGFKIMSDYEVEDMKLLAKIQALEIRSHNLLHQDRAERPLLGRWAQYLAGRSEDDLCPSPELKALLRGGVPREYRQRVWRWLVRTRTRTLWEHHPQRYQQLCEKSRTSPHPASRQIQLDLHRTLTTNQNFSSPSSPALQQLRRILLAFSWQNPAVGYCQGLNRLAAIALLVLQNEEDAFWCLVAVVEVIMPQDYYTKDLVASQADQRVLKDFMAEKLPRLAAHFEAHSIDVSLITFNWFLVVFVESLPSDMLLPVWDAFLYEGTKVIFRYALALFKYKEEDLLKIQDGVEIYQYLRFFTKTISDSRKLTSIAFNDMNPFPRRLLRNRRALHLERLQGELRELEEQQKEFVTENAERKDKELEMVSEDDDEP